MCDLRHCRGLATMFDFHVVVTSLFGSSRKRGDDEVERVAQVRRLIHGGS